MFGLLLNSFLSTGLIGESLPPSPEPAFKPLWEVDRKEAKVRVDLAAEYVLLNAALWDEMNYLLVHTDKFNLERFSQLRSTALDFEAMSMIYLGVEENYLDLSPLQKLEAKQEYELAYKLEHP